MQVLPLILLLLGIGAASWFAWISIQSLLQARALFRLARLPRSAPDERGCQAFYGRVRVSRGVSKGFGELLWCRTDHQVYRRRGKSSGWKTERSEEETAEFVVEAHEVGVSLAEYPTEVQDLRSKTIVHNRTGLFGWGHASGDRRTVYSYLPVVPMATIVGRLARSGGLERDNKLGLLLSPHEPGRAATQELWKGLLGLLAVTGVLALALTLYGQSRR